MSQSQQRLVCPQPQAVTVISQEEEKAKKAKAEKDYILGLIYESQPLEETARSFRRTMRPGASRETCECLVLRVARNPEKALEALLAE